MDVLHLLKAAVIGVVEGITEFLPISSTAHIILTQRLLGFEDKGEVFAVVIQLGAILAVCVALWPRLSWLVRGAVQGDRVALLTLRNLAIACVPVGIAGVLLNSWLENHVFGTHVLAIIAATSALGGVAILWIEARTKPPVHTDLTALPPLTCAGIGALQILAMIPGVSRSGASILGGMLLGLNRKTATEMSFFLAMPVMLGASALKLVKHRHEITSDQLGVIAVGFVVSFVVALIVVRWLLGYVATNTFRPFAWYRLAPGALIAALLALGLVPMAG